MSSLRDDEKANRRLALPATSRRELLRMAGAAPLLALASPSLLSLLGCSEAEDAPPLGNAPPSPPPAPAAPESPPAAGQDAGKDPGMASPGAATSDQLVTEIPSMQPLVQSLQYTHRSPRPDQQCSNCQLYTGASQDRGKCQLFAEGMVNAGGWCASWVQKVASTG